MNDKDFKLPRLYTPDSLMDKEFIPLSPAHAHYLHNVLRRQEGDQVRIFNGKDGEWIGVLKNLSKKSADLYLTKQIIEQPAPSPRIHLLFAPIKKTNMEWMIEKAVELGVSAFHPILTRNTETRKLKMERIESQIIEATEQCERLDVPLLHPIQKLEDVLQSWQKDIKILACLERFGGESLSATTKDIAIIIGPEGGFTSDEKEHIAKQATVIDLGPNILRAETASLKALSILTS